MKFYVVEEHANAVAAYTTLAEATSTAKQLGREASVVMIDCPVNADTVRRLLGNEGGYATNIKRFGE